MYKAKATQWTLLTFNEVDRVEFNYVASVYWALVDPQSSSTVMQRC